MGFTLCEAQIRFSLGYKKDIFGYIKDFFLFVTKQIYVKTCKKKILAKLMLLNFGGIFFIMEQSILQKIKAFA